ncbi:hypothetical protein C8J56DRAFT_1027167 [Mycena floridula]|nr:hypothetical protein C8J56DRAFT_1027167 [Mycena floridula]
MFPTAAPHEIGNIHVTMIRRQVGQRHRRISNVVERRIQGFVSKSFLAEWSGEREREGAAGGNETSEWRIKMRLHTRTKEPTDSNGDERKLLTSGCHLRDVNMKSFGVSTESFGLIFLGFEVLTSASYKSILNGASANLPHSPNFSTELGDENKRNQGILILRYWEMLGRKPKRLEIKGMALFLVTFSQRTMGVGNTD